MIKSGSRENEAINRHGQQDMQDAAAGVVWHAILQQTFLLCGKRTHSDNNKSIT